ncbi:MAG: chorismate synthase [Dysgonamonadaceae bacterium]|jgi:chorismate synthase|nr:chorismate synthase [Dysgonamonadaceae bacterium]
MNTFGLIFRLTSFGESHGGAIGGVIDGCPAGILLDTDFIQSELNRRRPGQSDLTTSRKEPDEVKFLSGIYEGKTTGTPVGFIVHNTNQHSSDYEDLKNVFRPSHADYTYQSKYGVREHRGGGRSSARESISRVVGGAIAKLALKKIGISVVAYTSQVGTIQLNRPYSELNFNNIEKTPVRCPDLDRANQMIELIQRVKSEGDTIGGVISCVCKGIPPGLGEPVFGKLHAALGSAMLSINAAKGFDYGMGFAEIHKKGSETNDLFYRKANGKIGTKTNHSGGIQGGISNGEDIYFRVAFKPVATLLKKQITVNNLGEEFILEVKGRHDPCVLPRAVPIVEAMAAMTILDYYLINDGKLHPFIDKQSKNNC